MEEKKLKIYMIGDPAYDVPLSKQFSDCINEHYTDVIRNCQYCLEFIDVSDIKKYDKFIQEENTRGIVFLYDELFSCKYVTQLLESEKDIGNPSKDEILFKWEFLTKKYFEQLYDKLIPLIEDKQIYLVIWTDIGIDLACTIFEEFEDQLGIELEEGENQDKYNICPRVFIIDGGNVLNNAEYMFKSEIFSIIRKILKEQIELRKVPNAKPKVLSRHVDIPLYTDTGWFRG